MLMQDSHDKRLLCNNVVYLGNWKGWSARARRLVKIRFGGNKWFNEWCEWHTFLNKSN